MQVIATYDSEKNEIILGWRTDPPLMADFKTRIRPGEKAFGLDFEEIKGLSLIETDPENGHLAKYTVPASPASAPDPDMPRPPWLRDRLEETR